MKYEIILRVQDTRYSDRFDKYRCCVSEDRYPDVVKKYESLKPDNVYGVWVLVNKLDDNGEFLEIIQ